MNRAQRRKLITSKKQRVCEECSCSHSNAVQEMIGECRCPLSRNDAIALYGLTINPSPDLLRFILEEQWPGETMAETVERLLQERFSLSCKGF